MRLRLRYLRATLLRGVRYVLLIVWLAPAGSIAHFSWPNGRIPYLDDLALAADPDQAVALNNARMDLQVRTCVRFYPRRLEKDFVFFTDLGSQVECWNMFDHTKGRVEVNSGPSCLEPMRRPHKPKRVFSDCDIEYVNHLYNCPRRRFVSPICPPGQNIMSLPLSTTTINTTETTTTQPNTIVSTSTVATIITITTMPSTIASSTSVTTAIDLNTVTDDAADQTTHYGINTVNDTKVDDGNKDETVQEPGSRSINNKEDFHPNRPVSIGRNKDHTVVDEHTEVAYGRTERRGDLVSMLITTQHPDWHNYGEGEDEKEEEELIEEETEETQSSTTVSTADVDYGHEEEEVTGSEVRNGEPDEESDRFVTTNPGSNRLMPNELELQEVEEQEQEEELSTVTITTIPQPPFLTLVYTVLPPMPVTDSNSSSYFTVTDETPWLPQPHPQAPQVPPHTQLMMTLITTPSTTTTTFAPPPPDWVQSVEASFESRQNGDKMDSANARRPENPDDPMVESVGAATIHTAGVGPVGPNSAGVEIVNAASAGAMGLGNDILGASQPAQSQTTDSTNRDSKSVGDPIRGISSLDRLVVPTSSVREHGGVARLVLPIVAPADYGRLGTAVEDRNLILVDGASSHESSASNKAGKYSISQTKVITTIEKSKYMAPCGSACSYSGDLVKLYRSYNEKSEITDHFYTTDRLEHHLMATQGYNMQPHMGHLGRSHVDPMCSCLKPLYRLYNDFMKDHLLTSTEQEKDMAERILGYKFERVLGFCTKEPGCGAYMPLYRFYNPIAKDHLYTSDQQEMHYYKTHPEQAYGFENIECYVWQHNTSVKSCPAMMLAMVGEGHATNAGMSTEDFARL